MEGESENEKARRIKAAIVWASSQEAYEREHYIENLHDRRVKNAIAEIDNALAQYHVTEAQISINTNEARFVATYFEVRNMEVYTTKNEDESEWCHVTVSFPKAVTL